jgi:iron-sulfur cluster repair protein YtfE (RIC family)
MRDTGTISGFFQHDHERLDALLQSFQTLKPQNVSKAKEVFTQFKSGLERHIQWEENLLFPLWEEKTGMSDGGPTFVMRHEHRRIEEQLQAIDRNVAAEHADDAQSEQALLALLTAHNLKEERVLYPAIDQVTTAEECRNILRKIQALPEG